VTRILRPAATSQERQRDVRRGADKGHGQEVPSEQPSHLPRERPKFAGRRTPRRAVGVFLQKPRDEAEVKEPNVEPCSVTPATAAVSRSPRTLVRASRALCATPPRPNRARSSARPEIRNASRPPPLSHHAAQERLRLRKHSIHTEVALEQPVGPRHEHLGKMRVAPKFIDRGGDHLWIAMD
jgi:hypothetical protein